MIYDIILIVLVLLSVFIGIKKGAAKTLLSFCAIFLAVVVTFLAARPVSELVYNSFVRESIENDVNSAIVTQEDTSDEFDNPISEMYLNAMDYFGESKEEMQDTCTGLIEDKGSSAADFIVDLYKPAIVGFMAVIIAVVLFLILAFIFLLIARAVSKVFRLPIINFFDITAGAFLGLLRGLLTIVVLAMVLKLLAPVISADSFFGSENIGDSAVFSYIYNGSLSATVQSFVYNLN